MCLITEQKKALIAKEDIICYKLVDNINGEIRSVHIPDFVWIPNQLNKTKLKKIKEHYPYDCRAAFAYPNPINLPTCYNKNLTIISEGFHAATTTERLSPTRSMAKCIIPKGSKYFQDATYLIVANQMILVEIISPPVYMGYTVNIP